MAWKRPLPKTPRNQSLPEIVKKVLYLSRFHYPGSIRNVWQPGDEDA
jgi:hypothetical protein